MERSVLTEVIERGLSQRQIARELGVSHGTVRHWLEKFKLETKKPVLVIPVSCRLCGKTLKDDPRHRTRCQSCNTKIRRVRAKNAAIVLLGGKCSKCGYDKHPAALEFHHFRGTKQFNIGAVANKSWSVIKKELEKCILLCSNCHRIEHSNRTEQPVLDEAAKYEGHILC